MSLDGAEPEVITLKAELPEGGTVTFTFRDEVGVMAEAFVIRHQGELRAYRNQCRHQPLTLDYGDGDVWTEDKSLLLCRNHGALFEPGTGKCVSGPCTGASLYPLEVGEADGVITVIIPAPTETLLE